MVHSLLSSLLLSFDLLGSSLQPLLILPHAILPFIRRVGVFGFLRRNDRLQLGELIGQCVHSFIPG